MSTCMMYDLWRTIGKVRFTLAQVLGAWGLGWEIWMDGMEVTQFTYFQQVHLV
ncbi:hypothetical protein IFM89_024234 [Coptis chinensis]|uniref:glycine--tRNA ligase n=1 Tax=Coptis chinensis TaxID=261450 RepID=A0A835H0D2_9MAGN|nr:hypothetical protein IFM89_024234 [Coptis chinensis]